MNSMPKLRQMGYKCKMLLVSLRGLSCSPSGEGPVSETRLTLRVDFGSSRSIGPGKIRLLEAIERTGSISQAGRTLGMSYRRAWLLIDDMNRCFRHAVVSAKPGGSRGGGAQLTEFGAGLVRDYRAIETAAASAARKRLRGMESALRASRPADVIEPRKMTIRARK
jgi:molybdate transport system regulatory protein